MISATIVADSISNGNRITTMEVLFPRFILAELNTHRLFSRNSASSRAIPFNKMVKSVNENPFIPIAWQKDHKGMQGNEYVTDSLDIMKNTQAWLDAKYYAINQATLLNVGNEVTKQLCNRLLEPFMWHKVLITATEWDNFFELRCPDYIFHDEEEYHFKSKKDAIKHFGENEIVEYESGNKFLKDLSDLDWLNLNSGQSEIHMMALAEAMWDAKNESKPIELAPGDWHIPYLDKMPEHNWIDNLIGRKGEKFENGEYNYLCNEIKAKIATARCARLSYQTLGDNPKLDYDSDLKLHDMLLEDGHLSPFEHCAKAMTEEEYYSFIRGQVPTGREKEGMIYNSEYYPVGPKEPLSYFGFTGINENNGNRFGWCNNLRGFIQYRYLLENKTF